MTKGWFVGDFDPCCLSTRAFEVACKHYQAGEYEPKHLHKQAVELTLIVSGRVRMLGQEFATGDIVQIDPGEATDFHVLEDTTTVVVKTPSLALDKFLVL